HAFFGGDGQHHRRVARARVAGAAGDGGGDGQAKGSPGGAVRGRWWRLLRDGGDGWGRWRRRWWRRGRGRGAGLLKRWRFVPDLAPEALDDERDGVGER